MKKISLLTGLTLLAFALAGKAQNKLTVDMGTASNYIANGRTLSDDLYCVQPGLYYSTPKGITMTAWFSIPYDRTASNNDEWNIIADYTKTFKKEASTVGINFHGYADYWLNPKSGMKEQSYLHGIKYNAGISFPIKASSWENFSIKPGYDFYYNHAIGKKLIKAGDIHEFLLALNHKLKKVDLGTKAIVSYNNGAVNEKIIPGWAYVSQQISAGFNIKSIYLRTSVTYQHTFEETINADENLLYFTVNILKSFKM